MKLIPILLLLTIPVFVSAQRHISDKANTVALVKQTLTNGIKCTIDKVSEHFVSSKYNLSLATKINSKVKNRKRNSSRRQTHYRQSEIQIAMHISVKKNSTFQY